MSQGKWQAFKFSFCIKLPKSCLIRHTACPAVLLIHMSTLWHQCGNGAGRPHVLNFSLWETLEWNARLEQRKMTPSNMFNSELLLLLLLFIKEWSWRCIQVKRSWLRDVNTKHMPWRWKDMQRQHFIIHFQDDLELPPTNVQNNTCAVYRDMVRWAPTRIIRQVCKLTDANTPSVCLYPFPSAFISLFHNLILSTGTLM